MAELSERRLPLVIDEQWDEARRLFNERLRGRGSATLTKDKYDKILQLCDEWDELPPTKRKEISGGNHMYWRAKYMLAPGMADDDLHLLLRDEGRIIHYTRRPAPYYPPSSYLP